MFNQVSFEAPKFRLTAEEVPIRVSSKFQQDAYALPFVSAQQSRTNLTPSDHSFDANRWQRTTISPDSKLNTLEAPKSKPTAEEVPFRVSSKFQQDAYALPFVSAQQSRINLTPSDHSFDANTWQRTTISPNSRLNTFSTASAFPHVGDALGTMLPPIGDRYRTTWTQGAKNVGYVLGLGVKDEVINHYGRLAFYAAIGVVSTSLAPLVHPKVGAGLAVGLLVFAGYELYQHAPYWYRSAKIVANPGEYTRGDVLWAADDLADLGARSADLAAGLAGGLASSRFLVPSVRAWSISNELLPSAELRPGASFMNGIHKYGNKPLPLAFVSFGAFSDEKF